MEANRKKDYTMARKMAAGSICRAFILALLAIVLMAGTAWAEDADSM